MRAVLFLICASMFPLGEASAETATLCEQTVDYTLVPLGSEVSPVARALHGVWAGSAIYPAGGNASEAEKCIAFIVETIAGNGAVRTIHISGNRVRFFAGPGYAIKPGVRTWNGKLVGETLDLTGADKDGGKYSYQLRASGNEMSGSYVTPKGIGRAFLKRQ
jgi:hypothetical protein